jgi:iron complex outermembrane recepter protein
VEGGSFGLFKIQSRTSARSGAASGTLSVSHTNVDGFRQQSLTRFTTVNLGGDYTLSGTTVLGLRLGVTHAPTAEGPGALTAAEVLANPDSAAASNINRKVDKDVSQGQLGLTLTHHTGRGRFDVALFGFTRDLNNWLATPPPPPLSTGASVGTYATIDRRVYGARFSTEQRLGPAPRSPRITAGFDVQRMRDDRTNARAVAGVPDTLFTDQRETVTELGPFAQLHWQPASDLIVSLGGRYDNVRFHVDDHYLADGVDNSGTRTNSAFSANVGVSLTRDERLMPYVNFSTAFETPTTTELVNQPNSTGGFNTRLDPQRTRNYEIGARGRMRGITWSVAGFLSRVSDAIVAYREQSGRAYFTNAAKLHNDGLELGVSGSPIRRLRLFATYTYARYEYADYKSVNQQAGTVDTLDGKRVPGVPRFFARLGVRAGPVRGVVLDIDHTMAGSMYADDANTQEVAGWGKTASNTIVGLGKGVTNLRLSWEGRSGGAHLQPFLGLNNLWDKHYVGAVTVNGTFGRVYETAPGRNYYVGAEIGWAR